METTDFHKAAERMVAKLHIFDEEWREILVQSYEEFLAQTVGVIKEQDPQLKLF